MKKLKNGKKIELVTHIHTNFRESNKIIKLQNDCVYLRYEDGLHSVVCLFGMHDTS